MTAKQAHLLTLKLPNSASLPIEKLAAVFSNTTNSYKFYWFLALLENLKKDNSNVIPLEDIIIEMVSTVWYPINYFKLSFGKQDQLTKNIKGLLNYLNYSKELKKQELKALLIKDKKTVLVSELIIEISRYVPYRFLSPYFSNELRGIPDFQKNGTIIKLANDHFVDPQYASPYRFIKNSAIEVNPAWRDYLLKNLGFLEGFIYWNLSQYLQKNNPNVSNIPEKLFPPEKRIFTNAKKFWDIYFDMKTEVTCIYSRETMLKKGFSIDHFLPWSFTAHDQLWNLLPTSKSINSSKSDHLPSEKYLAGFTRLQYDAFHLVRSARGTKEKLLEDYSILFNESISNIINLNEIQFESTLLINIKPQLQIAANMGFQTNWLFNKK